MVNLGCKVNRVESDEYFSILSGFGEPSSEQLADLIIVNTCTVTGGAEKKTRKAVRKALRSNDHSKIVVTGCAAAINPEFYEKLSSRIEVVAKGELKDRLLDGAYDLCSDSDETLNANINWREAGFNQFNNSFGGNSCTEFPLLRIGDKFNTRVGVKIQDGCNNACTYCIVHTARGRAVSRNMAECIAESISYVKAGVPEIILTGINLGSYCYDGRSLSGLLSELLHETQSLSEDDRVCRFRMSSIEPMDVSGDLIETIAGADGRICRHLHLPLQSGSSKVLHEMARPYDATSFLDLVNRIRKSIPSISLSTDIIVGFPGETDADFDETIDLAKACGFSKIHVFPYSKREGTPAAARTDQVPFDVKALRASKLRDLARSLRLRDYERRIGTKELVVAESADRGCTESYFEVKLNGNQRNRSLFQLKIPELTSYIR